MTLTEGASSPSLLPVCLSSYVEPNDKHIPSVSWIDATVVDAGHLHSSLQNLFDYCNIISSDESTGYQFDNRLERLIGGSKKCRYCFRCYVQFVICCSVYDSLYIVYLGHIVQIFISRQNNVVIALYHQAFVSVF